jgi:hypothetical protein
VAKEWRKVWALICFVRPARRTPTLGLIGKFRDSFPKKEAGTFFLRFLKENEFNG